MCSLISLPFVDSMNLICLAGYSCIVVLLKKAADRIVIPLIKGNVNKITPDATFLKVESFVSLLFSKTLGQPGNNAICLI